MSEPEFPTDRATVDERTMISSEKIERLRSADRPFLLRVNNLFGASVASQSVPSWNKLPSRVADAAQSIGFRPVCFMQWGHWPLPIMRQPQFIGPEGFVKLECYRGGRCYLNTMLDDGSGISTAPSVGGNANTTYLPSMGDFARDYEAHLAEVRKHIEKRGVAPIYRNTADAIARSWDVFYLYQCPTALAMFLMVQTWGLTAVLVYTVILLATR